MKAEDASLLEWVEKNGGSHNLNLDFFHEFKYGDVTVRGGRALKDIAVGDMLVKIPISKCLAPPSLVYKDLEQAEAGFPRFLCKKIKEGKNVSSFVQLVLLLLWHKREGDASRVSPYVTGLPTEFRTMLTMMEEKELAALKGTGLEALCDHDMTEPLYHNTVQPLLQLGLEYWKGSCPTLDDFRWACCVVRSRAFHPEGPVGPYLIPLADMLNHSSLHKATHMEQEDGFFQLVASRPIPQGEEVFNTYGDLSNAQLLSNYGFVEQDNPHNVVNLPLSCLLTARNISQDRVDKHAQKCVDRVVRWIQSQWGGEDVFFTVTSTNLLPDDL
eukprot:Ihof_evm25s11 gene=Ihof_evmTU25s11